MWHEARKQERMIRGLIVDYRRRAERRKDFYEKIKAEPTQFMQIHGRPCKIHLDPAIAAAGDSPAIMMPWQGDTNNLIDRFDVRAHLDYIPEVKRSDVSTQSIDSEERQCNYERYRILAQNVFLGIGEDKFLRQLCVEEQFGVTVEEKEAQKEKLNEKKSMGVAIGYNYNDPGAQPSSSIEEKKKKENAIGPIVEKPAVEELESDDDSDLEIIDMDLSIDVSKMEAPQAHELNAIGPLFGMAGCDLFSYLTGDADDAEHQKQLLRDEKEKAMFSGRKSRRERRAHRSKKLSTRVPSPPAYAARPAEPAAGVAVASRSASRSPSPEPQGIQFITSFGGDEDHKTNVPPKPLYADKLKINLKRPLNYSEALKKPKPRSSRSPSQKRSKRRRSRSTSRFRSSRSVSPRRSSSPRRRRSRSDSLPRHRYYTRSRSRSYSPRGRSRRSPSRSRRSLSRSRRSPSRSRRSPSRSRGYRKRSRSRSTSQRRQLRSRSRSPARNTMKKASPTKAAVPRYYGRKKEEKQSSSEWTSDTDSSEDNVDPKKASGVKSILNQNRLRFAGSSSKGITHEAMTLKEKLKKKMQAQLSKQLRADKRMEAERMERESRRQARRDEEMRDLAIKLRRKQREIRHLRNRRSSEESAGSRSRSRTPSYSGESDKEPIKSHREDKSKSRSISPTPKQIPVWTSSLNSDVQKQGSSRKIDDKGASKTEHSRRHEDHHSQPSHSRRRMHDGDHFHHSDNQGRSSESTHHAEHNKGSSSHRAHPRRHDGESSHHTDSRRRFNDPATSHHHNDHHNDHHNRHNEGENSHHHEYERRHIEVWEDRSRHDSHRANRHHAHGAPSEDRKRNYADGREGHSDSRRMDGDDKGRHSRARRHPTEQRGHPPPPGTSEPIIKSKVKLVDY